MKAAGYLKNKKPLPKAVRLALKITLAVILTLAAAFFTLDYYRIKKYREPPVFCVKAIEYDNGSIDYYGLFYKVWMDYDPFEDKTEYYATFWLFPKAFSV